MVLRANKMTAMDSTKGNQDNVWLNADEVRLMASNSPALALAKTEA